VRLPRSVQGRTHEPLVEIRAHAWATGR
jgi:hypothetical protein